MKCNFTCTLIFGQLANHRKVLFIWGTYLIENVVNRTLSSGFLSKYDRKFFMETSIIKYEHERFFRASGYLKLPSLLSESQAEKFYNLLLNDFINEIAPFRRDSQGRINRIANLYPRYNEIQTFFNSGLLIEAVKGLLGPNIELILNRHNHATLNLANANDTRLHRDILQWSRNLVTVITYLEDATLNNGCTYVVPTSQFLPFIGKPNNGGTWMNENYIYKELLEQALPIPAKKGDVLLIDSTVFHAVGENTGKGSRMSMTMAYRSVDELESNNPTNCILICGERLYKGNELS